jgi:arabinan endo-1,5-alpha-L-arabinosidase
MRRTRLIVCVALLLTLLAGAMPSAAAVDEGDIYVHDPSMIKEGHTYYVFSTGGGLSIRSSTNLVTWHYVDTVFSTIPTWVTDAVGPITDLWAPDISYWHGLYHLYYAGSTFGTNSSVIGLATNVTLDPTSHRYHWVDRGLVLASTPADQFNAIDPNLALDAHGQPWLDFGSFWSGIKMRRIDPATGKLAHADPTLYQLAFRPDQPQDAIEAPFIIYRKPYYYLFTSFDFCCQGAASTYNIRVGRATRIAGPYADRAGKPLMEGGGTLILASRGRYRGPGGESVPRDGARFLLVHHYYDAKDNGVSKLQINPLTWSADGWPSAAAPLAP